MFLYERALVDDVSTCFVVSESLPTLRRQHYKSACTHFDIDFVGTYIHFLALIQNMHLTIILVAVVVTSIVVVLRRNKCVHRSRFVQAVLAVLIFRP